MSFIQVNAKIIALIGALCCLLGCDIPGILKIENRSGSDISYIVYQTDPTGKQEKVEITISPEQKIRGIYFGFGQFWTKTRIRKYISGISRVEIISTSDTLVITDKEELYNFYRKRRRGLFKNVIKIKVK